MMAKIRDEGMNHSQVMEIVFNLTDANGPRLMQSPGYFKAANWAKTKLASWGLINANLEAWGNWGKRLGAGEILSGDDLSLLYAADRISKKLFPVARMGSPMRR